MQPSQANMIAGDGQMMTAMETTQPTPRGLIRLSWLLQVVTSAILAQTLFFKFTAAEESVYIFTKLGLEPWGRIGSGIAELIACVLLLIPRTVPYGALLSLGVISGAIVSHLTKLGIVVKDDGGLLLTLALAVFVCSLGVLWIRWCELVAAVRPVNRTRG